MNVHMVSIAGDGLEITIQISSRAELEKVIEWVPTLRPLYPMPDPAPADDGDRGSP